MPLIGIWVYSEGKFTVISRTRICYCLLIVYSISLMLIFGNWCHLPKLYFKPWFEKKSLLVFHNIHFLLCNHFSLLSLLQAQLLDRAEWPGEPDKQCAESSSRADSAITSLKMIDVAARKLETSRRWSKVLQADCVDCGSPRSLLSCVRRENLRREFDVWRKLCNWTMGIMLSLKEE